ncbi:uncharacterized protein BCR38DRAFT_525512 [Pseudomassariella vexata]|uniref:Uncharacterized protein n=1 Tax=Pseudomassariella vexata TaxID=1141098 RepID=A0A1Y2DTR7_9PEZI|nr:uncharacterized protein BCR38DRAFT_525512 [Pseudomassariella vexata]ORY62544.1 hypothetical protein BCR38DRAFT_525512 [Pseudomassariella vexata]
MVPTIPYRHHRQQDPNHATSQALLDLPKAEGTTLLLINIDPAEETDPANAVKELAARGIDHLALVIINAGVSLRWCKVSEVTAEDMHKHTVTNTYDFIWLFQAALELETQPSTVPW